MSTVNLDHFTQKEFTEMLQIGACVDPPYNLIHVHTGTKVESLWGNAIVGEPIDLATYKQLVTDAGVSLLWLHPPIGSSFFRIEIDKKEMN